MEIYVVDIETGVIDLHCDNYVPGNCTICEVGVTRLDLSSGEITPVFDKVCKEESMCSPGSWVFNATSLSYQKVVDAEYLSQYREELQAFFDEGIPVTSWSHDFDFSHLEYSGRGLSIPTRFWDPKITLTGFLKIPNPYRSGYKWPKVEEAYSYFFPDEEFTHQHRAIHDAVAESKIIYHSVKKWPVLLDSWRDYV